MAENVESGSLKPNPKRFSRSPNSIRSINLPRPIDGSKFYASADYMRPKYTTMLCRQSTDAVFTKPFDYATESDRKIVPDCNIPVNREPSYTKFKVPFPMVCKERYSVMTKKYEEQFRNEIKNLIDYQTSARDATYFVRIVSYTSLWPPYHNEHELITTSSNFYSLTPKENTRFQYIMSHDFS